MRLLIEHCDLLDGRRIVAIDQAAVLNAKSLERNAAAEPGIGSPLRPLLTIDGRQLLAIPGLISAHTHSPENFMHGATERMPLEPWLVWLYSTCGQYTLRDHANGE